MAARDLGIFTTAGAVAFIGASGDPVKLSTTTGSLPLQHIRRHGFPGRIYPVNPKYDEIMGLRCYHRLADIPEPVDLALIMVAQARVEQVLADCIAQGVRGVVLLTSGFAEASEAGRALQERCAAMANAGGPLLLGPNTNGMISRPGRVILSQCTVLSYPTLRPGGLALVTQSGGLGSLTLCRAHERGLGFSHYFDTGNEAQIDVADCLEFLATDPHTTVIGVILEGIKRGGALRTALEKVRASGKPLIALKCGRTHQGALTAASHTGAMSGAQEIWQGLCHQCGVIAASTPEELVAVASLFDRCGSPDPQRGPGFVVSSGGITVLIADECGERGLALPELTAGTRQAIQATLGYGGALNPLDVGGPYGDDPAVYQKCGELMAADPGIGLVVMCVPTPLNQSRGDDFAQAVCAVSRSTTKPVLSALCAGFAVAESPLRIVAEQGLLQFNHYRDCVAALQAWSSYVPPREDAVAALAVAPAPPPTGAADRVRRLLREATGPVVTEYAAKTAMRHFGLPVPDEALVMSAAAAAAAAAKLGYPVALKLLAPAFPHKARSGLVHLHVPDEPALFRCYDQLQERTRALGIARSDGILVQKMAPVHLELIVGGKWDPQFGPVLLFGAGGVHTELYRDTGIRLLPIDATAAQWLVRDTRIGATLTAGEAAAVVAALLQAAAFMLELADVVAAFDINPLAVLRDSQGVVALDALIQCR